MVDRDLYSLIYLKMFRCQCHPCFLKSCTETGVQAAILRTPIPTASTLPTHPSAASIAARHLSQKQLEGSIKRAANLINIAKKPIIYAGQGLIARPEGPDNLKTLADKAQIPVTTTLQGLGGFDELDSKSLHMLGMHGSPYANLGNAIRGKAS